MRDAGVTSADLLNTNECILLAILFVVTLNGLNGGSTITRIERKIERVKQKSNWWIGNRIWWIKHRLLKIPLEGEKEK